MPVTTLGTREQLLGMSEVAGCFDFSMCTLAQIPISEKLIRIKVLASTAVLVLGLNL